MKKLVFCAICGLQSLGLFAQLPSNADRLTLQAEFLYFLPTVDDTFFVTKSSTTSSISTRSKKNGDFDFTPGFRIAGAYEWCDNGEIIVRYSRLRATQSETVTGFISNSIGKLFNGTFPGLASSELDLLYQNVDVLYGLKILNLCKLNVDIQAGLEYAYIRLSQNYEFTGSGIAISDLNFFKEKTWGIGPQVGLAAQYDLLDLTCFCPGKISLVSRASSSLLVSETTARENVTGFTTTTSSIYNVNNESTWRIVPAFHARAGLNYSAAFSCVSAMLELGYEFSSYLRAIARDIDNDQFPSISSSFSNHYDFDLNGLYVAVGLTF